MPDRVTGFAVLFKDDFEHLMIQCQCADGKTPYCTIPAYAAGTPKPPVEHSWEYREEGDILHVKPSVNWVGVFHNDGAWDVKFARYTPGGEWGSAYDLFADLNGRSTSK